MNKILSVLGISIMLFSGCTSTGNMARFEQRSVAGVTSATFGDYTIPVISIATGPSATIWQTKDIPCKIIMQGYASTTNTTSILGMYESTEEKHLDFNGTFIVDNIYTNKVDVK